MSDEEATERREPESDGDGVWARQTAPQSPYTMRQVGIGLVVLVIGAVAAFVLPVVVA